MRSTAPPFSYVMASNDSPASSALATSARIGCADTSASSASAAPLPASKSIQIRHDGRQASTIL